MQSINFSADPEKCIGCTSCVTDCPLLVLQMAGDIPQVTPDREAQCIGCMHCLTICPTGAVSILGYTADDGLPLQDLPHADALEVLIRGRRTVRKYKDQNIDSAVLERLLQVAWQAPTGVNNRNVLLTVVDDKEVMAQLRSTVMERLAALVSANKLPEPLGFFASFVKLWQDKGIDTIFRGAPHILITSAPKNAPCPEQDCIIALSYFELFAQSQGIGTVWDGFAKWTFTALMPELLERLGVPADHTFGYCMAFGYPAVKYQRTVPLRPAVINRIGAL